MKHVMLRWLAGVVAIGMLTACNNENEADTRTASAPQSQIPDTHEETMSQASSPNTSTPASSGTPQVAETHTPSIRLPDATRDALTQKSVPYDRITLEVNAASASRLTAINETLAKEHNRTITLRGSKNRGFFYLYNLPLVPGENLIRLQAADSTGKTTETNLTIRADANRSVPIAMRATRYEGVRQLDTVVEVGTDLNASEYLFDLQSDGTVETVQSEGNFTLRLTEEGRYRPRVTVRTKEGLLYSSAPFALALDVKASQDQKDPKGATPLDVAKAFQTAVLAGDRGEIQRLTGNNPNILYLFYGNKHALPLLQKIYASVHEMHEEPWRMDGKTSVVYTFEVNGTIYGGGMELKLISPQLNTGRQWIVDFIY